MKPKGTGKDRRIEIGLQPSLFLDTHQKLIFWLTHSTAHMKQKHMHFKQLFTQSMAMYEYRIRCTVCVFSTLDVLRISRQSPLLKHTLFKHIKIRTHTHTHTPYNTFTKSVLMHDLFFQWVLWRSVHCTFKQNKTHTHKKAVSGLRWAHGPVPGTVDWWMAWMSHGMLSVSTEEL